MKSHVWFTQDCQGTLQRAYGNWALSWQGNPWQGHQASDDEERTASMPAQPLTLSVWYVTRSSEPWWWLSWLYQNSLLHPDLSTCTTQHQLSRTPKTCYFYLGFWDHGDQKNFSPLWTLSGLSKTKVIKLNFIFDFTEKGSHVRNAPSENLTFSFSVI